MSDSGTLPPAEQVSVAEDERISEDERAEIDREIDELVAGADAEASLSREFLMPQRSGVLLPFAIWIVAGAAFVGGFFYVQDFFETREGDITLESRTFLSTEAQLIDQLIRDSEEALAAKEEEISDIQGRLEQLSDERQNLEANLEAEVRARELELRAALDAELDAERARLAEAGESQAEIDARIAALETEREAELAAQLEAFRVEAREQVNELETQLAAQEAALEQTLAASREERDLLAEEFAAREAEQRAQFTAEIAQLEQAEQDALTQLSQLQEQREQEDLLTDRVLGTFTIVVQDIEDGLTEVALEGLNSLERLLRNETTGSEQRQQRRRTELALASTLRGLVQEVDVLRQNLTLRDLTTTAEETDQLEQDRAAELIDTAARTVSLAEAARLDGRFTEARNLYRQALATIPSLDQVYPGILDLESTRRQVALASAVSEAQSLLAGGNSALAIDRYLESITTIAADENDPLLQIVEGIDSAVVANQAALLDSQDALQAELQSQIDLAENRVTTLTRDLNAARNAAATAQESIDALESRIATIEQERDAQEARVADRAAELASLQAEIDALSDQLAGAETAVSAAESRAESLQASLETARSEVTALEGSTSRLQRDLAQAQASEAALLEQINDLQSANAVRLASLEEQIAALQQELAERPEVVITPADAVPDETAPEDQPVSEDTQLLLAELRSMIEARDALVATQRTEVDQAQAEVERSRAAVSDLELELEESGVALQQARGQVTSLQADVEASEARIESLQDQIADLRENRSENVAEAGALQSEVERLSTRVTDLEALEQEVEGLITRVEQGLISAQAQIQAGNYELALRQSLQPFTQLPGRSLFPGLATTATTAHEGVVSEAEAMTTGEARDEAFADVVDLATQVQQNINAPRDAAGVQSFLRREPEIQEVADELFEIVELSARAISAPEIEFRLLGSVSRVAADLVVVERLVALEAGVGDQIEIRRAESLGQEIPIAVGTILEVTDRRVVTRVDEILELDQAPENRDLVYIAQE